MRPVDGRCAHTFLQRVRCSRGLGGDWVANILQPSSKESGALLSATIFVSSPSFSLHFMLTCVWFQIVYPRLNLSGARELSVSTFSEPLVF